jgi:hypothetical protein
MILSYDATSAFTTCSLAITQQFAIAHHVHFILEKQCGTVERHVIVQSETFGSVSSQSFYGCLYTRFMP